MLQTKRLSAACLVPSLACLQRLLCVFMNRRGNLYIWYTVPIFVVSFTLQGTISRAATSNHPLPRRLAPSTGNSDVLIVRVTANAGTETTSPIEDIVNTIFNGSPSVASQFQECSNGALTLTNGGSIEIVLPYSVEGLEVDNDSDFISDLQSYTEGAIGTSLPGEYEHVIFCLPEGTTVGLDSDWVGFAEIDGYSSYYNHGKCQQTLTVMHELGHNMGLGHSSQTSDGGDTEGEYEDRTGVMGIDDRQTRKCFNAPHSSYLGWYDDSYTTTLDTPPDQNIIDTCLLGVGEYSTQPPTSEYQLWYQIGDIFISFNRDAGPNGQTQECNDQVVVHQAPITSPSGLDGSSNLLDCLNIGDAYQGEGFIVDVTAIDTSLDPACARISIVVTPTPAPTRAPGTSDPTVTQDPTSSPTTEQFFIDYFLQNFFNDEEVTIVLIGSCGNEVGRQVLPAGQATNGQFLSNVEDQYTFLVIDGGGGREVGEGGEYSVSYRGVLQSENADWTTAQECFIIGDEPPLCDGISCPTLPTLVPTNSPSASPSFVPTQTSTTFTSNPSGEPSTTMTLSASPSVALSASPSIATNANPSTMPSFISTRSPSSVPVDNSSLAPTVPPRPPSQDPTLNPTENPGLRPSPLPSAIPGSLPTLSPLPTSVPLPEPPSSPPAQPEERCHVVVRTEECLSLLENQIPIPGCSCYNYCNGNFLSCCPFDAFCAIQCPSGNFVGGCQLLSEPSSAPSHRSFPPSEDEPTHTPLPPSGDNQVTSPTSVSYGSGTSGYFSPSVTGQANPSVAEIEVQAYPFFFWSDNAAWATSRAGVITNRKKSGRRGKLRQLSAKELSVS